jgi:hypothetical protein
VKQNPDGMTYEEVIAEVRDIHSEIQARGRRIHELATAVHRRARKETPNDGTVIYLTYANALNRYAGSVEQASIRSLRTARILDRLPEPEFEPSLAENRRKQREERKKKAQAESQPSPMESLIDSYVREAPELPISSTDEG